MRLIITLFIFVLTLSLAAAEFTGFQQSSPTGTLQIIQINNPDKIGDIYLLKTPDGKFSLTDTGLVGTAEDVLIPALEKHGVKEIEYLILTHFHSDHVGGALVLLNDANFKIKKIICSPLSAKDSPERLAVRYQDTIRQLANLNGIPVITAKIGAEIDFGSGIKAKIIGTANPGKKFNLNSHSIVYRLTYGDFSALFTGDCGFQQEALILAGKHTLKSDILKVGHHAGAGSTSENFLNTVTPKIAIVTMPLWLSKDPRGIRVEKMIKKRKIPFFRSWEYPELVIFSDGKTFGATGIKK